MQANLAMTIPDDPEKRFWVEISASNPKLADELRPCLVGFLGFDYSHVPGLAGTGFVIAGSNDLALVITAKHVITEGMLNLQRPVPQHAPSALFIPDSSKRPILNEEKFRTFWMGSESADLLYTRHISYHDSLDIACCIVTPQESYKNQFKPISIPLDTYRPYIGEVVHMISQSGMKIYGQSNPTGPKGIGQKFIVHRYLSIRRGIVTGAYPQGFRQYPWQCFTTSIPAESGMSGGFVYVPRDGQPISACGIVCADNSVQEARTNYLISGESVIACAWPALSLTIPQYYSNDAPMSTLLEMMKAGHISPAIGGVDHIEIIDLGNGDSQIKRSW